MNKFTQGPWVLGTYDNATYKITGPQGALPFIAIIPADRPEREANARLIAAAPEMYAELEGFVNRWGKYKNPPTGEDLQIYLDNARAALAKAGT